MRILAVETSCDETAAAIVVRHGDEPHVTIEASVVASQIELHQKYGGVYPEVASREHIRTIAPVLAETLGLGPARAGCLPELRLDGIDRLAVTHGPGLIGSLLVGVQTLATLSYARSLPLYSVNHLSGHIYAAFIQQSKESKVPRFPLMALIVSGGHTMLVYMQGHHHYQLLGQTRDDAAGEAFDKVAKLLGLSYPGGPVVSKLAQSGNRQAWRFPIGLEHDDSLDFSFSGLKTAVLRLVEERSPLTDQDKADSAAAFELAVVEALLLKSSRALDLWPVRDFVLGGGVSANGYLRERFALLLAHRTPAVQLHVAPYELCTDNAAVIGASAAFLPAQSGDPRLVEAFPRLSLV